MNLHSYLFMFVALALTCVPFTQAKTTVFDSGMIQPFSLVFGEDGTAYGVEYEKGNRVFSIKPDGEVQFIAGRNTPGGKKLGCLLYTSPSPRDQRGSRMPSSA